MGQAERSVAYLAHVAESGERPRHTALFSDVAETHETPRDRRRAALRALLGGLLR